MSQLLKNWHNNKLYEASLPAGNLGRVPVTEHGHFKVEGLLGVALVEELFEEEVGPLRAQVEFSEGCTDVACVQYSIGHQLLAVLDGPGRTCIDQAVRVGAIGYTECIKMLSQLIP